MVITVIPGKEKEYSTIFYQEVSTMLVLQDGAEAVKEYCKCNNVLPEDLDEEDILELDIHCFYDKVNTFFGFKYNDHVEDLYLMVIDSPE